MAFQSVEELNQDVKEQLPYSAQKIFMAAFNSASSDGMGDEAANQVAWNSVKTEYEPEPSGGKWRRISEGGTRSTPLGNMPGV